MERSKSRDLLSCLSEPTLRALRRASPAACAWVEPLVSPSVLLRMEGVDAIGAAGIADEATAESLSEALPFVIALAVSPSYPAATSLAARLARLVSTLDRPPRALALPDERARHPRAARVLAAIGGSVRALVRCAHFAREPETARAAAFVAARFPEVDSDTGPALHALMSGASDDESKARLLYALCRIQLACDQALHPNAVRALMSNAPSHVQLAAALAICDHPRGAAPLRADVESLITRSVELVEQLYGAPLGSYSDPRGYGVRFTMMPTK